MNNRNRVIWCMMLVGLTLCIHLNFVACSNAQSSQTVDKSELAKNLIVKITGDNVSGSGIVFGQIKEMLFIVTANHVVRPQNREAQNLRVTFNFWFEEIKATFTGKFDRNLDLAILLVDLKQSMLSSDVLKEFLPLTQLQYVSDVKAGNKLYPIGHPAGRDWYVPTSPKNIFDVEGERILIEFECNQGFSGGGIFDEQWDLAGMIRTFNPPLCEAISFDRIQEMLKKSRFVVSLQSAPSSLLASPATPTPKPLPTATPKPTPTPTVSPKPITREFKVGLVFDIGGRGDQSFNDSAYRGLLWAEEDFGIIHVEIEPGADADRETGLRMIAGQGYDLVIGVGFLFTDAIRAVADEFPKTKFAIVDGYIADKPNVSSLLFSEQDGSFLVGVIAGMKAQIDGKDTVGFIGGMDIPLIHKFEAGYRAGVQYACYDCKILSDYAGSTSSAFVDPVKGKELALAQIDKGAAVIYHASGLTGAGVFEAGKERKVYVIGVDSNQNYLGYIAETGENFGLTSMLKQVDVAVYVTIKDLVEGKFQAGVRTFGLADTVSIGNKVYHGVDYAMDEYNKNLITRRMVDKINEATKKIIAGEIEVPIE